MKVAITGSSGFFGSHLMHRLSQSGYNLRELDRSRHNLFQCDSLSSFLLGVDVVIHLAAVKKGESIEEILRVNILGTKILLDAVLKYAPESKFVFVSSIQAQFADNIYAISKRIAEDIVRSYRCNSPSFKKGVILRFANLYGSDKAPFTGSVIPKFIHQIIKEEEIIINGNGDQKRDFLHVEDAVSAIIRIFNIEKEFPEYMDICTGKAFTINEVIEMIEKCVGKPSKKIYVKEDVSRNWEWEGVGNYLNTREVLGWQPKISLEKGIASIVSSIY